ncbi:hypothetical protein [Fibrobacter sp. UWB13]|uniref:hypothetical protein n=1 Tax=Fibrobacter sp. UWB13 TaxID=1896204 RepID=UPI000A09783C|nr:hypothetical protein [Fibrobacter sp. UWB13]SMG24205.1 hypothetical protein SAMN05720489_1691 [Fibrobacter sp. UWB13]
MLGNITIDKSSMVLNYFLHTIHLIKKNGGKLERTRFEREMAHFVGVSVYNDDGTTNRTPYNKSKFPRYFGFVESVDVGGQEFLYLTGRGIELSSIIGERALSDGSTEYYITNRNYFITLIFYSLWFDTFGKNNCGAEQSCTDIEPPKIVFRALQELGKASAEEIYYVIYGLNGFPKQKKQPIHSSFEDAIEKVKEKRNNRYDYKNWIRSWNLKNLVSDCKIINIFTEKGFGLLSSNENKNGDIEYSLSSNLKQEHLEFIHKLNPYYKPLFFIQDSDNSKDYVQEWLKYSVYGKFCSNRNIFHIHTKNIIKSILNDKNFVQALKAAYINPKESFYLEFDTADYNEIIDCFADNATLLDRIDDVMDDFNGWSSVGVHSISLYSEIVALAKKSYNGHNIKEILSPNTIRLPANLNIIGV